MISLPTKQYVWAMPDGEIVCIQTTVVPSPVNIPGSERVVFGPEVEIDPLRHKIADGRVVERSAVELANRNRPTLAEVKAAIANELSFTDRFAIPDFPVSAELKEQYPFYRQDLRDLSKKYEHPEDYVANWPMRPDGTDAIPQLRERLVMANV